MPGTLCVPPRRPRSCDPPRSHGASCALAARDQEADALRPVELVRGRGEQIRRDRVEPHRDLAERLRRIDVQRHAARAHRFGDPRHRLHDAGLVVRPQQRHQRGVRRDRGADRLGIDEPVGVDRNARHAEALGFERGERFFDRRMLGARCVTRWRLAAGARDAVEREVVRLGRTAREHHLARLSTPTSAATRSRARSTSARAAAPSAWALLGLPGRSRSTRSIAAATSSRTGVVAL